MKIFLSSIIFQSSLLAVAGQVDYSCDFDNDPCPSFLRNDGVCDSENGINLLLCFGGDCFDCDDCGQFDFDCASCVEHGCHWCGAAGKCTNTDRYEFPGMECVLPSDYSQSECVEPSNFFSDPLYSAQEWVFDMINVMPAWKQGYTGRGIRVRVNDDGVDANNPEFAGRFDVSASCEEYQPPEQRFYHGTAVSSILAGGGNNGQCAVGVAPEATISSCFALRNPASVLAHNLASFDISQNSYGVDGCAPPSRRRMLEECPFQFENEEYGSPCSFCDFGSADGGVASRSCESAITQHCNRFFLNDLKGCTEFLDWFIEGSRCHYNVLSPDTQEAIVSGITDGRDGKGIIFVWASGNAFASGDDTNFQGYLNTRFSIVVGAVGKDGFHASYSTPGAALFVTAPGGDFDSLSGHIVAGVGSGCDQHYGTSFACPVVSGVVALILEANDSLSWRDVQGILASTSRMVEDPNDETLVVNAAGLSHSNFYGFGIVDANAAVEAAKTWELYEPEQMLYGDSGDIKLLIPDSPTPVVSIIELESPSSTDFIAESVVAYLDLQHFSRGDLQIILTSPQGTQSILHPGKRPENTLIEGDDMWKLLTVKSWGEYASGAWNISITDIQEGDVSDCADWPWFLQVDSTRIDCNKARQRNYCANGSVQSNAPDDVKSHRHDGWTMAQACCSCGGGIDTDARRDGIIRWRIVVYGRPWDPAPTAAPAGGFFGGVFGSGATTLQTTLCLFLACFGGIFGSAAFARL